jgi:hypothetical protein
MKTNFKFLIIGAGRGGTSLLMAVLDYHSELEVISEYNSVKYLMGQGVKNESGDNIINNRISSFISSCEEKASHHLGKKWGNKITTEQLGGLNNRNFTNIDNQMIFDTFFQDHLKKTKIIFILRDGRSCTVSKTNRTKQSMEQACRRWNYSVEVYKYLQIDNSSLCIKFEDLLLNPIQTLTQISKFLGITFEENMLNGVSNKKLLPEYRNKTFIKEKAIPPIIDEKYFQLIKNNLEYCGYI